MAQFSVNAQRFDPYKNFKFRVKWDGRYVAGVSKVGTLKRTTLCHTYKGPKKEEFVHGAAPVTRALMREARLSLSPIKGTRWSTRSGAFSPNESPPPHAARFHQALMELEIDLPIAEFLETHFADRQYSELRRAIKRMVEG